MGARTLTMSCSSGSAVVSSQEQLMARMYSGCNLPGNYMGILESRSERCGKNVKPLGNIKTSFLVAFARGADWQFCAGSLVHNSSCTHRRHR